MTSWTIGIIGGSGLYAMDILEDKQWLAVDTPWGRPSDELLIGRIHGVKCVFLPRHGRGHPFAPGTINYRANIDALKRAGCTDILAVSAIGSLREELPPGHFVLIDQFIDRTMGRANSFFGTGFVAHVSMADPICPRLSAMVADAAEAAGAPVSRSGTYVAIEGPQFSSLAESLLYRSWGCDVIGMTAMPEAKLAREAEIPYALLGLVTDYDCWRDSGDVVDTATIIAQLNANADKARHTIELFVQALPEERDASPIDRALDFAVITARDARDEEMKVKLQAIGGRCLAGDA
jgi:5'-methylthioadenosine phosphorylase